MWSADFRQSFLSFIFLRWKIKIKTQTQLFVRFRIDKTNPNANRLKSNGKESAMCSTHDWIAAQGIPFHSHNSQIWGYVDGERERESAEQNRTEETRSWDLHVFIAEALQIWIMQIPWSCLLCSILHSPSLFLSPSTYPHMMIIWELCESMGFPVLLFDRVCYASRSPYRSISVY